jgi:carbamate kinase
VTREDRAFVGVDAVIDKDLASARLALEVGVDLFLIATDVAGVYTDFGGATQALLSDLSLSRAEALAREGALGTGAMLPKVEACCQFIKNGGRQAVITDIGHIAAAVAGTAGTRFKI